MTAEEFIETRLDPQQKFFSSKSSTNKKWYFFFKVLGIIIGAMVPFIVGFTKDLDTPAKIVIGLLSIIAAVFNGVEVLYQQRQKWVNYRMASELLKQEKIFFLTQAGPYVNGSALPLLVSRVEAIISAQNSEWKIIAEQNIKKDNPSE